jgi:hypothetical protein
MLTVINQRNNSSTPYLIQVRKVDTYDWITYQGLFPDRSAAYSDEEVDSFAVAQGDAIMEYVVAHNPNFWDLYSGIRVIKILAYGGED